MTNMMESTTMNKWWGYVHMNGSIQVKRYFDLRDLDEARESDFVARVFVPFLAQDRQSALDRLNRIVNGG
jgi:hypothetical protein